MKACILVDWVSQEKVELETELQVQQVRYASVILTSYLLYMYVYIYMCVCVVSTLLMTDGLIIIFYWLYSMKRIIFNMIE